MALPVQRRSRSLAASWSLSTTATHPFRPHDRFFDVTNIYVSNVNNNESIHYFFYFRLNFFF
jgi:hypothetical protein